MKVVIQRVSQASVEIEGRINGEIGVGLMILVGYSKDDTTEIIDWMCHKIAGLRIFTDDEGKLNNSLQDVDGSILLISNFTLYGDANKGFRPSYSNAAPPDIAIPLYNYTIDKFKKMNINIQTGIFGAMMNVKLINDGPVTIILEK